MHESQTVIREIKKGVKLLLDNSHAYYVIYQHSRNLEFDIIDPFKFHRVNEDLRKNSGVSTHLDRVDMSFCSSNLYCCGTIKGEGG